MSVKRANLIIVLLGVICLMYACDSNRVYEKNIDVKAGKWELNDTLNFDIEILDTTPKNMYINVRHNFEFAWRNVWLKMQVVTPNDSIFTTPINIQLSQPDGKWFGNCTGDICMIQVPLEKYTNYSFKETGLYRFSLIHEMREVPLAYFMSAGIRVENAVKQK